jgi:WD40 repeat protein
VVAELSAHKQEVCGLKWSFDERMLASGGNDNKLFVWSPQLGGGGNGSGSVSGGSSSSGSRAGYVDTNPTCRFSDHCAAVVSEPINE